MRLIDFLIENDTAGRTVQFGQAMEKLKSVINSFMDEAETYSDPDVSYYFKLGKLIDHSPTAIQTTADNEHGEFPNASFTLRSTKGALNRDGTQTTYYQVSVAVSAVTFKQLDVMKNALTSAIAQRGLHITWNHMTPWRYATHMTTTAEVEVMNHEDVVQKVNNEPTRSQPARYDPRAEFNARPGEQARQRRMSQSAFPDSYGGDSSNYR